MTKFEEEFDNNVKIFDVIGNYNSICCEVDQVKEVFKDWQPHQPMPVVPEYVAEYIETKLDQSKNLQDLYDESLFNTGEVYLSGSDNDFISWFNENTTLFEKAWIIGYTVQKPKRFYLKNKMTNGYLCQYPSDKSFYHLDVADNAVSKLVTKFTQEEINNMQIGSYEKIEVEE